MEDKKNTIENENSEEQETVKLTAKKRRLEHRRKIEELMEEKRFAQYTDDFLEL